MSKGLRTIGAASALAGALVLAVLLRGQKPQSTEEDDQSYSEVTSSVEAASNLQSEHSAPLASQSESELVEASRTSPSERADDRFASASAVALSMPPIAEDVRIASPEVAGHISDAERAMASQGKEPVRSPAMERQILSEIAQKALGLEITYLQVDCRVTLCRLELVLAKSFLEKKFGNVTRDATWPGREPVSFFIKALDLEWRYTTAFGGLDRYGTPVVLGYIAMPLPSSEP